MMYPQVICPFARILFVLFMAGVSASAVNAQEKSIPVAGWVERAILFPGGVTVHAKLDTGAENSSINAKDQVIFNRAGKQWVRFSLTNRNDRTLTLERPIVRVATIKRHFSRNQQRPVVELDICVGSIRKMVEVNLVDRTGLDYQLLIGRNFLSGVLLADSGNTYLLPPACPDF